MIQSVNALHFYTQKQLIVSQSARSFSSDGRARGTETGPDEFPTICSAQETTSPTAGCLKHEFTELFFRPQLYE